MPVATSDAKAALVTWHIMGNRIETELGTAATSQQERHSTSQVLTQVSPVQVSPTEFAIPWRHKNEILQGKGSQRSKMYANRKSFK